MGVDCRVDVDAQGFSCFAKQISGELLHCKTHRLCMGKLTFGLIANFIFTGTLPINVRNFSRCVA